MKNGSLLSRCPGKEGPPAETEGPAAKTGKEGPAAETGKEGSTAEAGKEGSAAEKVSPAAQLKFRKLFFSSGCSLGAR